MSKYKNKKKFTILLFFIILSGILFLPVIYLLSDQLSKTTKVDANILLVEGWLPPYAIEMAYDEYESNGYDHLITTGSNFPGYYLMAMNGYLIFHSHDRFKGNEKTGDHTIEIDAYSEMGNDNSAHFNVFINDSIVADFIAGIKKRKYEISWKGDLSKIDSIMIQFDNDMFSDHVDRNLYIKEIIIDQNTHISYQDNSAYDIGALDGKHRINNDFSSFAELARDELISLGFNPSLVIAIPCNRVKINRTLTSALAFRDWLKTSNIEVKGINIVTLGTHARRTWMTYNKILKKKYEIGIISLPNIRDQYSRKYKILKTLREAFGLIYYWLILIPY
jgi:hypothetical protein